MKDAGVTELPSGITTALGMCGTERNAYQKYPSPAYTINKNTFLTVGSVTLFPNGFPLDFSILTVIKPKPNIGRVPLFSIYSSESEEVLSLLVGTDIALYYQDTEGNPKSDPVVSFGVNIDDGR